jgi:uncharacterized FAD-dependent dehydrogenase
MNRIDRNPDYSIKRTKLKNNLNVRFKARGYSISEEELKNIEAKDELDFYEKYQKLQDENRKDFADLQKQVNENIEERKKEEELEFEEREKIEKQIDRIFPGYSKR